MQIFTLLLCQVSQNLTYSSLDEGAQTSLQLGRGILSLLKWIAPRLWSKVWIFYINKRYVIFLKKLAVTSTFLFSTVWKIRQQKFQKQPQLKNTTWALRTLVWNARCEASACSILRASEIRWNTKEKKMNWNPPLLQTPQWGRGEARWCQLVQKQEELQICSLWKENHIHRKIHKTKRQRTLYQIKKQDKTPEKQLNEVEIGNLPEKEFRIMIVKMIQDLGKIMEAKIEKTQEMFNKDRDELKNKQRWTIQ